MKHNQNHWEQYKKAKNEVNASIKAAKTKSLSDRIKNSSGNKLYKSSLGRKSNTTVKNELFFVGKRFTDKQERAD